MGRHAVPRPAEPGSRLLERIFRLKENQTTARTELLAGLTTFLTMLSYSIGDGLALGFIAYPLIKLLSGRARDVNWVSLLLAAVLILYFEFVRVKT